MPIGALRAKPVTDYRRRPPWWNLKKRLAMISIYVYLLF